MKNKIYKYITVLTKNVHFDILYYIINKYNNTYHRTIKIKPIDFKSSTYFDFDVENNDEDPKFKM